MAIDRSGMTAEESAWADVAQEAELIAIADSLITILSSQLKTATPVLRYTRISKKKGNKTFVSGNMKRHQTVSKKSPGEGKITVSGPHYNVNEFKKRGVIKFDGKPNYALLVNKYGAFGRKTSKSRGFATNAIKSAVYSVASSAHATVIWEI